MKPVRIYLSLFKNSVWDHTVYREIQTLRDAWDAGIRNDNWEYCAVHIGHDRPEYADNDVADILTLQAKPVLMTEAAKWGLPSMLSDCSYTPIGNCTIPGKEQPCGLYLALDGWGYKFDAANLPGMLPTMPAVIYEMEGWVKEFTDKYPNTMTRLQIAGIYDDASYTKNVQRLEDDLSTKAGNYRFNFYKPSKNLIDPFDILSVCPEWLLNCTINRINLTVRLRNVFVTENIQYVRDITHFSAERLLKIPNMGRKSMRDLANALLSAFGQHSENPNMLAEGVVEVCLYDHVEKTLSELPDIPHKIITARLGADGTKPQTLQTLGEMFGVTRERIRQIEKKYIASIIERESWDDLIHEKISALLSTRRLPLYLDMLAGEDKWFRGFEGKLEYLQEVIVRFSEDKVKVIFFEGRDIICSLDQTGFDNMEKKIRATIAKNIHSDWSKKRVEQLVATECLGHGVPALSDIVWEAVQENLHFATNGDSEVLVGMGRGADNWVAIALEEAEMPLHYSELHRRVNSFAEKPIDIRRVHSCLTANPDAKLFDRGTYGLKRHFDYASTAAEELITQVEEIIDNGPEFKQWHAAELLQILFDEGSDYAVKLNNYELGILLEESKNLICLGKQIWVSKHREGLSTQDRIQTLNAINTVLEDAGMPLKTHELMERVARYRGMKAHMQIHATERMIKVAPNTWGLVYRDLPFSNEEKDVYLAALFKHLENEQHGIHISEVPGILHSFGTGYPIDENPFVFFGLCGIDSRFKTWLGQLIGLSGWESCKRDSIASAFRKLLPTLNAPTSTLELQERLEDILGRPVSRVQMSGLLCNSKALYDKTAEKWYMPDQEPASISAAKSYMPALEYQAISSAHGG